MEADLFVVRIKVDEERTDRRAFRRKEDAKQRFDAAWFKVHDGDLLSVALFEFAGTDDDRKAVEAVDCGDSSCATLLAIKEPLEVELSRIDLDFSLDELIDAKGEAPRPALGSGCGAHPPQWPPVGGYDLDDLRGRVGAIFQGVVYYNLSTGDNIAVGRIAARHGRRPQESYPIA